MTFYPQHVDAFKTIFKERKEIIRAFEGCRHLELWQDEKNPAVFFTYSIWESESLLDHYRFSTFFKDTWALTKSLFSAKAEAWTVNSLYRV